MSEREFTAEIEDYVVLKLRLEEYRPGGRPLPEGFELADWTARERVAREEKRLLKSYFRNWKAPLRGRLRGWRQDSPIYVLREGRLVGGVYLVATSEFNDDGKWGQLHYAFMDPSCKGLGIYRTLFGTAVERARAWGLEGLYLNSDRHLLPEVYERWGAVHWKTISKADRAAKPKRPRFGSIKWLGGSR